MARTRQTGVQVEPVQRRGRHGVLERTGRGSTARERSAHNPAPVHQPPSAAKIGRSTNRGRRGSRCTRRPTAGEDGSVVDARKTVDESVIPADPSHARGGDVSSPIADQRRAAARTRRCSRRPSGLPRVSTWRNTNMVIGIRACTTAESRPNGIAGASTVGVRRGDLQGDVRAGGGRADDQQPPIAGRGRGTPASPADRAPDRVCREVRRAPRDRLRHDHAAGGDDAVVGLDTKKRPRAQAEAPAPVAHGSSNRAAYVPGSWPSRHGSGRRRTDRQTGQAGVTGQAEQPQRVPALAPRVRGARPLRRGSRIARRADASGIPSPAPPGHRRSRRWGCASSPPDHPVGFDRCACGRRMLDARP